MSIKARAREIFEHMDCNVKQRFTPTFGLPTDLHFGDAPDEGTSDAFSRSDHRHGMPAGPDSIIESYNAFAFQSHELMVTNAVSGTPSNGIITRQGAAVVLGEDTGDESGGFGCIRINTGVAAAGQASGVVLLSNVSTANYSPDATIHLTDRMRQFQCRARFKRLTAPGSVSRVATTIGGFNVPTSDGSNFHVGNISDGIGFLGEFDTGGAGNWRAVVYVDGTRTQDVDLGIGLDWNNITDLMKHQLFTILRDGGNFGFYINQVLVGTLEDVTLPTRKVCGWGVMFEHTFPLTTQHFFTVDHLLFRGIR